MVTARSAGSSYMNCGMVVLHLAGSASGVDQEKNLEAAIDVNINRVAGSRCGDTQIQLDLTIKA